MVSSLGRACPSYLFWLGIWIAVGIILEATHRRTNFLMIHPTHLQYSQRAWTPRAKRRGVRIRYEDIVDAKADEAKRTITILHRPESRLSKELGIHYHQSSFVLRFKDDVREVLEVLKISLPAKGTDYSAGGLAADGADTQTAGRQSDPP